MSRLRRLGAPIAAAILILVSAVPVAAQEFPVVTLNDGIEPNFPGCGFLTIDGATGVTDCGPYEYAPSDDERVRLATNRNVTFTIADGWTFGAWTLRGIAEDDIPASLDPTVGQVDLDSGSGGTTITAHVPADTGQWRLFLYYQATKGSGSLDIDRPDVWLVDLRLPDSSTELFLGRGGPDPVPLAPLLVALGVALLGVAARLARVPTSRR
jgi:hypothetical protein